MPSAPAEVSRRQVGDGPPEPSPSARIGVDPSPWQRALEVAIIAAKSVTIACAIDAWVNADSPRLRGKAMRTRAVGYTAGLFVVPAIWRILPNRGRYPRGLDLAVTTPLLIDAMGNALGLYQDAHLDDVVHFLNAGIVSGVAGALFAGQVERPWHAAVAGAGAASAANYAKLFTSPAVREAVANSMVFASMTTVLAMVIGAGAAIAGETAWEITEYVAMKAGAGGMDLTYDDTMVDLAASALGAVVGGVVTWLRMPRAKGERRRGWRHAVSGWRDAGESVAIVGGQGTVADTAAGEVAPA